MHADKKKEEKKHFFHPSARSTKTLTTQSTPSNLKYVKVSKGAYNTQKLREDQDTVTFKDVTSSDEGIGTNSQKVKEKKKKTENSRKARYNAQRRRDKHHKNEKIKQNT